MLTRCYPFPCWPLRAFFDVNIIWGLLAVAGMIFSLVMLIDCLKRPQLKFADPLTKKGEYDKLIWAAAIVVSLWIYFLGAILYFLVVKRTKQKTQ
ncbi:hypothetical protein ACFL1G_07145 [Planctomycetota bacterium]